jgi:hypothetical protein
MYIYKDGANLWDTVHENYAHRWLWRKRLEKRMAGTRFTGLYISPNVGAETGLLLSLSLFLSLFLPAHHRPKPHSMSSVSTLTFTTNHHHFTHWPLSSLGTKVLTPCSALFYHVHLFALYTWELHRLNHTINIIIISYFSLIGYNLLQTLGY